MGAEVGRRIRQGIATLALLVVALVATNVVSARPTEPIVFTRLQPAPAVRTLGEWPASELVHLRFDSGCIFTVEHGTVPIIWPHGTKAEGDDTIAVGGLRLRDGDQVTLEGTIQGHGGGARGDLDRCLGEAREAYWVEYVYGPDHPWAASG